MDPKEKSHGDVLESTPDALHKSCGETWVYDYTCFFSQGLGSDLICPPCFHTDCSDAECDKQVTSYSSSSEPAQPPVTVKMTPSGGEEGGIVKGQPVQAPTSPPAAMLVIGLTSAEVAQRLQRHGRNEVPERREAWQLLLIRQFVGLLPFMMEVAALLAGVTGDYGAMGVVLGVLGINAAIGFHEEHRAQVSLACGTRGVGATVTVQRDGKERHVAVSELVPADVIRLRSGDIVPADCTWITGDTLTVDTAALTGEPLPRHLPDPRLGKHSHTLLSGFIVQHGEAWLRVDRTGIQTEAGQATALHRSMEGGPRGRFQQQVLQFAHGSIATTIVMVVGVSWYQIVVRGEGVERTLLVALSLCIAAVPLALPLLFTATQAIGARNMSLQSVTVTHLGALQDVASMTVLCCDKTGTLTDGRLSAQLHAIRTFAQYKPLEVLRYASLGARDTGDVIDGAICHALHRAAGSWAHASRWRVEHHVSFSLATGYSITHLTHLKTGRTIKVSKGVPTRLLEARMSGDGPWEVADKARVGPLVTQTHEQLVYAGYKTVGVAMAEAEGPWVFLGIIPLADPPRHDSRQVVTDIRAAGVKVKMLTGDRADVACETARLVGLGHKILPKAQLDTPSAVRDAMIEGADGFSDVLPTDKQEVVFVLQRRGEVVGLTGHGCHDSAAMAQANVAIATHGAHEAARCSADLIVLEPGLGPILAAVMEARRVFKRLRSYILYRMASSIMIVSFLTLLIFIYNEVLEPRYVLLLALLNDVTMLAVAYDNATPSSSPDLPTIQHLVQVSLSFGVVLTVESWLFYLSGFHYTMTQAYASSEAYRQSCIYVQMAVALGLLLLSTRAKGPSFLSQPSWQLLTSLAVGLALVTVLALTGAVIGHVWLQDVATIYLYDTLCFVLIDLGKAVLTSSLLAPSDAVEKGLGLFKGREEAGAATEDPERQPLLDT